VSSPTLHLAGGGSNRWPWTFDGRAMYLACTPVHLASWQDLAPAVTSPMRQTGRASGNRCAQADRHKAATPAPPRLIVCQVPARAMKVSGPPAVLVRGTYSKRALFPVLATSPNDDPAAGPGGEALAGLDEHPEHGLWVLTRLRRACPPALSGGVSLGHERWIVRGRLYSTLLLAEAGAADQRGRRPRRDCGVPLSSMCPCFRGREPGDARTGTDGGVRRLRLHTPARLSSL
jgi:hypothetical protein